MRSLWLGILLAAVESLAFGQLDSDTLTVTVTRSVNLQPDQIVFVIIRTTPASIGLDEVLASLKGAGITAGNFYTVFSNPGSDDLNWLFTLAVPFSKISATAAQLSAQKVSFSVDGSQVSAESERAQQCSVASLMPEAKARAKKVADTAELAVGDVLTISAGNAPAVIQRLVAARPPSPVKADRALISSVQSFFLPNVVVTRGPVSCFLTVKFKLLRYH